jgi:Domain of unknown function (DUF4129)
LRHWAALFAVVTFVSTWAVVDAAEQDARGVLQRGIVVLDHAAIADEDQRSALIAEVTASVRSEPTIAISDWLVGPLETSTPDLGLTRARFAAALDAIGPAVGAPESGARRQALDDVLSGPPFQTRDLKSFTPEWLLPLALLVEWLAMQVSNIIHWSFDRLGEAFRAFLDGPVFASFVSLLGIAAVTSLVLLYRRGLRAALMSETELREDGQPLPLTSAQALDRAGRIASDGRYRDACHFSLLSALLWIEEHGQTRFERSATNWEHLRRLDPSSPAEASLRALIGRFDRLWYGQADVSSEEYRDLEELVTRVRQAGA